MQSSNPVLSPLSLQRYILGGELGEGLGEGTHMLTQFLPRGHQQHVQVCMELKQHQGLGNVRVGMDHMSSGEIPTQ